MYMGTQDIPLDVPTLFKDAASQKTGDTIQEYKWVDIERETLKRRRRQFTLIAVALVMVMIFLALLRLEL